MHPTTVLEIIFFSVFVILTLAIVFLLPGKFRKKGLMSVSIVVTLLLSFFAVRPYWIDYQVMIKTDMLTRYLDITYPNEEWEITRREGRQYNPYHLDVTFMDEKYRTYTYNVVDEKQICQNSWIVPDGSFPRDGKYYETNHCD